MNLAISIFFVIAGLNHFYMEDFYIRIMPDYIPYHKLLVAISGFFEILLGLLLLKQSYRKYAKIGLILLLIAVFPANIHMAANPERFPEFSYALLWLRLPLQFLLIYLVVKIPQ